MTSRRHLVPVPTSDDALGLEPGAVPALLSDAELREALIEAGHSSTGPDQRLYVPEQQSDTPDSDGQ